MTLDTEVHQQMFLSCGQSEAKPPVFRSQASLVLIYQPAKERRAESKLSCTGFEELIEMSNKAPDLDICEGYKLIMSFKTFISNAGHEPLKEYQDAAKKLSPSIEAEHSEMNKRWVISKFTDKSTEKAVYGIEKFKRDMLIVCVALGKIILDVNRRI
ncbi:hypothetical protein TNCV_40711 [Trichonephila clavipes]|nr:hypothetical protein TNCV_40711 [Trichonephila clavipes]